MATILGAPRIEITSTRPPMLSEFEKKWEKGVPLQKPKPKPKPKKKKPLTRKQLQQRRRPVRRAVGKAKPQAQILSVVKDLHGQKVVKVKSPDGVIQTVTLSEGANKPRGAKAKGQAGKAKWNMKPAKFRKVKGIRDDREMIKEPKRQYHGDRYKSEMEEAKIRSRIAQAGNVRDKELAMVKSTASREAAELRLRNETRAATITELEKKNAGLTASHNVAVRNQSQATLLGGDVGELNKIIARRGKSAIRQLILKGEITDMSTLVQLDLEAGDLRDLQRTLEKEATSYVANKTYFYRTGKGDMKSGKFMNETGTKITLMKSDGSVSQIPKGQMIDPSLVAEEEVKAGELFAREMEAEARSRSASAMPSPRRRERPRKKSATPEGERAPRRPPMSPETKAAFEEEMAKARSGLAAILARPTGTQQEKLMLQSVARARSARATPMATPRETREAIKAVSEAREASPTKWAMEPSAAVEGILGYASSAPAAPEPEKELSPMGKKLRGMPEPERAPTPEPEPELQPEMIPEPEPLAEWDVEARKAFEGRAADPLLTLELMEEDPEDRTIGAMISRAGQWEPQYRKKDDFVRRGNRYNEDFGLRSGEVILVDNRKETHTAEGRPIIWGNKEILQQKIKDSKLTGAQMRKATKGIDEGMVRNRSYWINDKSILRALGFQ